MAQAVDGMVRSAARPPQEDPMPSTTVIIADDHEPMRTLVRSSLELAGLRVLAVAGTGR
jgi:hypothetical protein